MSTDERLDRLTGVVETLAGAVTAHDSAIEAHDRQIGGLIELADKTLAKFDKLHGEMEALERQWRAYLKTLPRQ